MSKMKDDFLAFVKRSLHEYADGKSMVCTIEYKGEIVGNCGFHAIDHDIKSTSIGYTNRTF